MLNKKWVEIVEYDEEIGGYVAYDSVALRATSDEMYAEMVKNPWKFLSGAVKHFLKKIQIVAFKLVDYIPILTDDNAEELYEMVCEDFPDDNYVVVKSTSDILVYHGQVMDTFRADLSGEEKNQKLRWLIPYVQQFRVLDKLDMLVSKDLSVMFKAVMVTV